MTGFKDLFSAAAYDYATYRPDYPRELFEYLAALTPERQTAWDVGAGSGQASLPLAEFFEEVIATDPSRPQLSRAPRHPKVRYEVAPAEASGLPDSSVDLIASAQAAHWFRLDEFYGEARRVAKPGAVLALWCYGLARIHPEVDAAVLELYSDLLGPCWDPERKWVETLYRDLPFPFEELKPPRFEMRKTWSLEQLIGYLGTWSALRKFADANGAEALRPALEKIRKAWGDQPVREVRWELGLRVSAKVR